MKTSKFRLSILYFGLAFIFCGCFTACSPSLEPEGDMLIRHFFDLMTEGDFEAAANMLYEAAPGMQGPGFTRADFVSSFEAGAKVNYTILSLTDGDEVEAQELFAPDKQKYFFPDEVPNKCQTYLIELQLNFFDLPEPNISSVSFIQKISLLRQEDHWTIGYFTFPSVDACYNYRESFDQTAETAVSTSDGIFPQITEAQQTIVLMDETPEETVLTYYQFLNNNQPGDADRLLATGSPAREQFELNLDQFPVYGRLVFPVVEISDAVNCANQAPLSEDCQELTVRLQLFYEGGFWGSPNGDLSRYTIRLIKEENHWKIWEIKLSL
ncbi:MAG: hypothetical protein KBA03_00840 [Anaerolineaceae bacterium]|nr:hypothetical protein [Anaerolineaceae bacterium]